MAPSAEGSSTSPRPPSPPSLPSARESWTSASPGSGLGRRALRALAARHRIRPTKVLGQHFLADPNLARRIASLAGAAPGVRILEIGAGLGSLTVALAEAGAEVLAVELDRGLLPALEEVTAGFANVKVRTADALEVDWAAELSGGSWRMASNLPYNVAVPLLMEMLERVTQIDEYLVMVQREVGERLAARPGEQAYGSVSARVAYYAEATTLRRVPKSVFWPEPKIESVLVRLTPRQPPVPTTAERLFPVIEAGFAQRRKTMANALVRLGLERTQATEALERCGLDPRVRAEQLGLPEFACLAEALP